MVRETVDANFSTGAIKKQLSLVIENLSTKVNELKIQEGKYDELMNNLAGDKIMMSIGDGYFAEYSNSDARSFLNRRIDNINHGITDIEGRIREAKATFKKFEDYSQYAGLEGGDIQEEDIEERKFNEEGLPYMDIQEELDEDGNVINFKINDGPIEEIAPNVGEEDEEEDEEDEGESTPDNFESPHTDKDTPEISNVKDDLEESDLILSDIKESGFQDDLVDGSELPIMDIVEVLDALGKILSSSVNPAKSEEKQSHVVDSEPLTKALGKEKARKVGENIEADEAKDVDDVDQVKELLEDMEIIEKSQEKADEEELLNKIDKLDITSDDKFRLKLILLDEYRRLNEDGEDLSKNDHNSQVKEPEEVDKVERSVEEESENNNSFTNFGSGSLAMNTDEILELELLADDFDEEEGEAEFADDEEWDFEFSEEDEEEDDDEDIADDLLYGEGKPDFISNNGVNSRLWDEVMAIRKKDLVTDDKEDLSHKVPTSGSKKSVRFATELDIFEIENISQELKNIQHVNQNFSRFKQERMVAKIEEIDESFENKAEDIAVEEETSSPISEIVTEKILTEVPEPMVDLSKKKKSRFRMMREENEMKSDLKNSSKSLGNQNEEMELQSSEIAELELSITDVFERLIGEQEDVVEQVKEPIVEPFGEHIEEAPVNDVLERAPVQPASTLNAIERPISDIIERTPSFDVANGIIESESKETPGRSAKKSRFKMQRESPSSRLATRPLQSVTAEKIRIEDDKPLDRRLAIEQSIADVEDREIIPEDIPEPAEAELNLEDVRSNDDISYVETSIDYQSMQNDMDTMAKEYVLGMYDDDIATEGPVVDKLEDFEEINKIVEEREKSGNGNSEEKEDNQEEEDEDEDEGPVLQDIIENDISFNVDEDNLKIEDNLIQEEVHNNYHRLRRQLMQARERGYRKTEEELQYEPIDEDGNPIKVSRFRAAQFR